MVRTAHARFALGLIVALCATQPAASAVAPVERVSLARNGSQANGFSGLAALSTKATIVGFTSYAGNLVPRDDNNSSDVFVRHRRTDKTSLISLATNGDRGNGQSAHVALSSTGRYVVFSSLSDNLVSNDTNERSDIFLRNRKRKTTKLVSVSSSGERGNLHSFFPSISADDRYIAFYSESTNMVPDDTNEFGDVFIRDREAKTTTRISLSSEGEQGVGGRSTYPRISSDGRFVTFMSLATNLAPGDGNALRDVFLRDLVAGTTTRVSLGTDGGDAAGESTYPTISADGGLVAFHSTAANLVEGDTNGVSDVFVWERSTMTTARVSVSSSGDQGSGAASFSWLSGDGRYVVFESRAPDIVEADDNGASDVFLRDLSAGTTTLMSSTPDGSPGDRGSNSIVISRNGRFVAFGSAATDLVPGDSNEVDDVFLVGPLADS